MTITKLTRKRIDDVLQFKRDLSAERDCLEFGYGCQIHIGGVQEVWVVRLIYIAPQNEHAGTCRHAQSVATLSLHRCVTPLVTLQSSQVRISTKFTAQSDEADLRLHTIYRLANLRVSNPVVIRRPKSMAQSQRYGASPISSIISFKRLRFRVETARHPWPHRPA